MKPPRGHLVALGACAALFLSAGCGASDDEPEGEPLPAGTVSAIERRLDEVQRRYDAGTQDGNAGACQDIENDSYRAIDELVSEVPQDVDPDVREALEASVARLKELTGEGCADVEEEPVETETAPAPVTPAPAPEPPPTTPTETQPTTPDEKKEEEKPPDEEQDGNGEGQGNGQGEGQGNGNGSGGQPAPPGGGN